MKSNARPLVCSFAATVSLMAQDVFQETTSRVELSAITIANILVVLGLMALGGKYLFWDRGDHGAIFHTILGGVFLLGARAIATQFLPVATP